MKLRRTFLLLSVVAALLAAAFLAVPSLIRFVVITSVQKAVPGSTVTVGACDWIRGNNLLLQDIRVSLKSPSKNFPRLQLPSSGKSAPPLLLASVTARDLVLDVQTADLSVSGTMSFTRNLRRSAFQDLTLDIPSLTLGPAAIKNIRAASDTPGGGHFEINGVSFDKFSVEKITGRFRISDAGLLMDDIASNFLGGTAKGRLTLARFGNAPVGTAEVDLDGIPIAAFLKLWEWDKKCAADGSARGHLIAEIARGKLTRLDGALVATNDGSLVILDQAFLENIATRTRQPIEIVKASFENYHYNTGTVGISLEENGLRLQLDLEGEKGKRDLEVTLHDWL